MVSRRARVAVAVVVLVLGALVAVSLAQQRALAAERTHVTDRLDDASCLSGWGVDEGTATREVSVTGAGVAGLAVTVRVPYAYTRPLGNETLHADAAAAATYRVSVTGAHRMAGDSIDPC
ncbi:hypothetical protein [Halosimplex halophilum]|uniref:hypothetical protein n=1 Tax=Halosimplex halophilum TaxID=2559572 RepID=UPI00107F1176|nr:hypothetical protein [Halosimplex halophilum]